MGTYGKYNPLGGNGGGGLPSQAGNVNKVLATDGTSSSWQYAGLGAGSLGTNNIVLGKANPITTGVRDIVIGTGTASITSANDSVAIGHNANVGDALNSVVIGSGSGAGNSQGESVAIGYAAVGGWYSVVVGSNSSTWTGNNGGQVVVGSTSTAGQFGTTIGGFASSAGASIAIGRSSNASGAASIALGFDSSTDSIANIMAIGSNGAPIDTVYLGKGAADQTTANAVKIQTQKAAGTNIDLSAGTLTLAGSRSTGNKAGGDVIIATAPAGSSGSSLNAHVERLRVTATGEVKVPNYILSPQLYNAGTQTGNFSLDLGANGPCQQVTINAAGPLVLTLSNPVTGGAYLLKLVQGATTGTITFPANVKWGAAGAPTLSSTTGLIDIINLYYDGTDYYGTYALGF